METSNPVLKDSAFSNSALDHTGEPMTLQGTVNKTFVLLALLTASAAWVWSKMSVTSNPWSGTQGQESSLAGIYPFIVIGGIAGFITAIITTFKRSWAPITAPFYALCEGLAIGGISAIFELRYPGLVIQAVMLTFGTLFSMLVLYKSRLIKVDQRFITGLFAATGAIALVYLVSFVLGFFGRVIPFINGGGIVGIGFSLIVVGIAAFNLILDFYVVENGVEQRAPHYMEWYAAFGLIVTLVWLYMEILRLLSKLRDRR